MQRALDIARSGSGYVHPNPLVGCVIVKDDEIISDGYHGYYGGPHAEVNAIQLLEKSGFSEWDKVSLYVTLEPCSHYGKTPPCTNLILEKGIQKVFVASADPNPIVAGRGIEKLRAHGVCVEQGLLEKEAIMLNKRFFTFHLKKRPYIILKWAESRDGFISKLHFTSRDENILSSPEALKFVHLWRSEEQSILVGYNTVVKDNPLLTVRLVSGKNPVKIVLDKTLDLDVGKYKVFQGDEKVMVFNGIKEGVQDKVIFKKIFWENKEEQIIQKLYEEGIVSVFIEGGRKTLEGFLTRKMFDEVRIIKSRNKVLKEGIAAPHLPENIELASRYELEEDTIEIWKNAENVFIE